MNYFGLIFGGIVAIAAIAAWYRWHRSMTGEDNPGRLPAKGKKQDQSDSLEAFVAAYRRGAVSLTEETRPLPVAAARAPVASAPAAIDRLQPALPARRDAFLSGATKLAYYVCKSGLRDHHVFAQVRLQSLCTGKLDARLADAEISLLVCNAGMSIVAAIDVIGPEAAPADGANVEALRSLGIRYLKLSPKSLPKPEDIRTLLYRM